MPQLIRGDRLAPSGQRAALAHFQGRYTGEHVPLWVRSRCDWEALALIPVYRTDKQWLRNNYIWCINRRTIFTRIHYTLTKKKGEHYVKVSQTKTQGNVKASCATEGKARRKIGSHVTRQTAGKQTTLNRA